jgi:hypothetical protein
MDGAIIDRAAAASGVGSIHVVVRLVFLVAVAATVSGCWTVFSEPDRLYSVEDELAPVRQLYDDKDLWRDYLRLSSDRQKALRNEIITARMYAVDLNYTQYEARLGQESQGIDFAAGVSNQALTIAAGLVPAVQTKNILAGMATGVGYVDTAYNEKILLKQAIQHVQLGMRQARYEQAAIILENMKCEASAYPLGLALSDVELYYRAGTFTSGMVKATQNLSDGASTAKAVKDSKTPAKPAEANAKLAANAVAATVASKPSNACASVQVGPNGARGPRPS